MSENVAGARRRRHRAERPGCDPDARSADRPRVAAPGARGRSPRPVDACAPAGAGGDRLAKAVDDRDRPGERGREARLESDRSAERAEHGRRVELRQPDQSNPLRESGQQRVGTAARALARPRVPVAGDCAQRHDLAAPELRVTAGGVDDGREWIHVRDVEAPGDEPGECVLLRRCRDRAQIVAEQRDPGGAGVEAFRVRADHVSLDAAATTFVDRAEPVDEKVVADVVPAVSLHVVDLDPAHDRGRLRPRVRVRPGRVMDDGEPDGRRERGPRAHDLLVRAPRRAGDDRRRARLRQRAGRDGGDA